MNGQQQHPTVGMNGMGGSFPPQGQPLGQAMVPQGMIGAPQFYGPAPVNGYNPQTWQPMQQQQMQPQMQQQGQMMLPPQGQPQQPQFQQHPTAPWGQQFEQPGYQAPQTAQRPMMQRLQVQGQEILDGPGVPLELRGRTMGQAMQIYQQLADDYIRRGRQGQPQQQPAGQPQFQQQGQQPPQPGYQQGGQQPAGQQPRQGFFQNPDQALRGAVTEAVQEALQPVTQFTQQQATQQAYQFAQQSIPDLQQLQGEMQEIIRDTDPRFLADPKFWEGAADLARGRQTRKQMMGQQQQQQQYQPQQQMQSTQYYGPGGMHRAVPAQQGFPQPMYQFFTEGPTAPSWGQPVQGYGEFSQEQARAMQGFGMTPDQYRAYQGGTQQQQRRW